MYIVINELPSEIRFCFENVVVAGLIVSDGKPDLDVLLRPITRTLKELEYGVEICINQKIINLRLFILFGVFDKPARASILNIMWLTMMI